MVLNPLLNERLAAQKDAYNSPHSAVSCLGLVGLDAAGVQIPLLRASLPLCTSCSFPYARPRALRLHQLGGVRTPLFAVGLSLATVMGTGLLMTTLYPLLGFERPLALVPVVMTQG